MSIQDGPGDLGADEPARLRPWLPLLACPRCHGRLDDATAPLRCPRCRHALRIDRGVIVAVDLEHLSPHLRSQVAHFEHERAALDDRYVLLPWQRRYLERWLSAAGPAEAGAVALDCGTGTGYMAIELARRGARVIACDLTLASLVRLVRIAEAEGVADRVLAVCCTADELPVRDGVVASFIANGLLEHVPDQDAMLRACARVCAADATLMLTVPLRLGLVHPLLALVHWGRDRQIGHLRRYDLATLRRVLDGWTLLDARFTGHLGKALRVLANLSGLGRFDEEQLERIDDPHQHHERGASNVVSFWRRGRA